MRCTDLALPLLLLPPVKVSPLSPPPLSRPPPPAVLPPPPLPPPLARRLLDAVGPANPTARGTFDPNAAPPPPPDFRAGADAGRAWAALLLLRSSYSLPRTLTLTLPPTLLGGRLKLVLPPPPPGALLLLLWRLP